MPSNYSSLVVRWYSESSGYVTNADITADVKSLPLFTDTGTGEVNQARIIIRALDGNYITSGNIIDVFDRFQITCTDLGGNTYDRVFEVIDIIPSQNKSEGTLLTIDCLGIEYHTQQIHMSKPYYFENAFNVVKDIGNQYEENNGFRQPLISEHDNVWNNTLGNDAPKFTVNNYEYGIAEESCYNRWMDVLEKLGASVSSGGALTFYEMSFTTPAVNQIALRFRASGDNTPTVTVKNAKVTNPKTVGEQEGMLSNPTGTNVLAWGSPEHGTLPVGYSKYFSGVEYFTFRPEWVNGVVYSQNSIVKITVQATQIPKHYISLVNDNNQSPGNPSFWTQIDMSSSTGEVNGDNVQYSPWTDDKSQHWKNSMANPSGTLLAWDQNLVIWDEKYFRTWVDARAVVDTDANTGLSRLINKAASTEGYAYDYTDVTTLPRGFRVLVDVANMGTSSGVLEDFDNMIAEWTGSEWRRKYNFISNQDKIQIAVLDEGKVYEGDKFGTTPTWTPLDTTELANDCFHPVESITEVAGFDTLGDGTTRSAYTNFNDNPSSGDLGRPDVTKDGTVFAKNINSALKFTYKWSDIGTDTVGSLDTQLGSYYKRGGWANFRLPFPVNDYNSISETVGGLYKPATLDLQNMHNLSDGSRGFNQGGPSQDLGTINGIAFWIKFSNSSVVDLEADDKFRVFMIDSADNVMYADFNIEFRDHWEDIRIPISAFRIYRGRRPPYGLDQLFTVLPPKDLGAVNQFEPRNVKFIGVQWQLSYDEYGRYNPIATTLSSGSVEVLANAIGGGEIDVYIDAFRFTKPLLVTSGKNTTRNLEPNFLQRGNITNYWQLLNDAKSQLEIEQFKHKEYNIESSGDDIFDIPFGNSFLLENDNLVYLASPNSNESTNKIQLVNKRAEYSITKPEQGIGGLRRRMNGSKVFT